MCASVSLCMCLCARQCLCVVCVHARVCVYMCDVEPIKDTLFIFCIDLNLVTLMACRGTVYHIQAYLVYNVVSANKIISFVGVLN